MNHIFTLKRGFILFLLVLVFFSAVAMGALQHLLRSAEHLRRVQADRARATELATRYKDYAQALTRNAMAFVASEQPEFEQAYRHYTDLLHGKALDSEGRAEPLIDQLRGAGFTETERATLESAYAGTLALAEQENQAINTAKGLFDDGQGGLKIGLPQPLLAKVLLFGQQYIGAAARLARDIDDFDIMQSNRHAAQLEAAAASSRQAALMAAGALAALLACSAAALFMLYRLIKKPLDQGVQLAQRLARGDLAASAAVSRRDELGELLTALNGIGKGLQEVVEEVHARSGHIAAMSRELAGGNADLSYRTAEQAASLQQTAAAMEQLSAAVRQNACVSSASADRLMRASAAAGRPARRRSRRGS